MGTLVGKEAADSGEPLQRTDALKGSWAALAEKWEAATTGDKNGGSRGSIKS